MTLTRAQIELALRSARTIQRLYPGGDLTPNIYSSATDTQGLATPRPDGTWELNFPGTASRRDMLTDIMVIKKQWGVGYIHWGVRAAVWSIIEQVRDIIPTGAVVEIGGHSLGGGIAQGVADTLADSYTISTVNTFGGLRTFNRAEAESYNARVGKVTLRFVNHGDIVPLLPLQLWIPRTGIYWHTDNEVYINAAGQLVTDRNPLAALPPLVRKLATFISSAATQPNLSAVSQLVDVSPHFISTYIKRLEALA